MMNALIQRYRQKRKAAFLAEPQQIKGEYAFIGVGMHSIQNLYPVLSYLGVKLRWIHSRTLANAQAMTQRFPGAKATDKLQDILSDEKLSGVFICTHSSVQHGIALRCIEAGKNCFIEKPFAKNQQELNAIITAQQNKNMRVTAGHQKRFSPCYEKLRVHCKQPLSYHLRYEVGAYPEGDLLSEVFVHPIDLAVYLFGEAAKVQCEFTGGNSDKTILALMSHANGTKGVLEMSAKGSWQSPVETLRVDAANGTYTAENFRSLKFVPKEKKFLGIPLEKLRDKPKVEQTLFSANGFIPEFTHNEIYLAGYYGELLEFLKGNSSNLQSVGTSFKLMDAIRAQMK